MWRIAVWTRALLLTVLGLGVVASLLFVLLQAAPEILMRTPTGGPSPTRNGPPISLQEQLQLQGPLHEQYLGFLQKIFSLDLGPSVIHSQPVVKILAETAPRTFTLFLWALGLAFLLRKLFQRMLQGNAEVRRFQTKLWVGLLAALFLPVWGTTLRWVFASYLQLFPVGGLINPDLWQATSRTVNELFWQLGGVTLGILAGVWGMWQISARWSLWLRSVVSLSLALVLVGVVLLGWQEARVLAPITDILYHMLLPLLTLVPVLAASSIIFLGWWSETRAPQWAAFLGFSLSATFMVELIFAWGGMGFLWRAPVRGDFPVLLGSFWVSVVVIFLLSAGAAAWTRRPAVPESCSQNAPNPGLLKVSLLLLGLFALAALAHPVLIKTLWATSSPSGNLPYDPIAGYDPTLTTLPAPPSAAHLLGTDRWARDVFSQLLHGAGRAWLMGLTAALVALGLGTVIWWVGRRRPAILELINLTILGFPVVPALLIISGLWEFDHLGLGVWLGLFNWPLTTLLLSQATRWSRAVLAAGALTMGYALSLAHLFSYLRPARLESLLDWGLMLDPNFLINPFRFWWLVWPAALCIVLIVCACYLAAGELRERSHS